MQNINPFSPKLDIISENIIFLLSIDSKVSINDLARKLAVSRKRVENRQNKLYSSGLIKPLLIYNHKDVIKATILIKLSSFDNKVISSITELNKFIKVKETLGAYDLSLLIIVSKEKQLFEVLTRINKMFHQSIQNMDVIRHDIEDTLGYKSFCHDIRLSGNYEILDYDKGYTLAKDDDVLITMLRDEPLISYNKLVKSTGWNYLRIKSSIDRLRQAKIIRFSIDPDYQKLGLEFHNLLIKINLAKRRQFEKNIVSHPKIHWMKRCTGSWDYILSVTASSMGEFIDVTREIRTQNKEIILNFGSLISNIHVMRKG